MSPRVVGLMPRLFINDAETLTSVSYLEIPIQDLRIQDLRPLKFGCLHSPVTRIFKIDSRYKHRRHHMVERMDAFQKSGST